MSSLFQNLPKISIVLTPQGSGVVVGSDKIVIVLDYVRFEFKQNHGHCVILALDDRL